MQEHPDFTGNDVRANATMNDGGFPVAIGVYVPMCSWYTYSYHMYSE